MADLDELSDFFAKHPEDAKFELEKPEEAAQADTLMIERSATEQDHRTDFEKRCEKGYRKFIADVREWVRQNNDVIISVCGPEGSGKSYFCTMKMCRDLDPSFTLDRNVLFRPTPETLEKKIFEVRQYGVHLTDEAMDVLYKRQAMTSGNVGITKMYARIRKFNRIAVIALPEFTDLDPFFRQRRVRIRVEIIERGLGFIMVAKNLVGNSDPWFSDYNSKILEDSFSEMDLTKATGLEKLAIYEKFRCFETPILWDEYKDPESIAVWAKYEKMARDSNLEARNEDILAGEHLAKPDKAYRTLFAELSRRLMAYQKTTPEELYSLFPKMLGTQPPFSFGTFKHMVKPTESLADRKKRARMAEQEMVAKTMKPSDLMARLEE